MGNNEENKALIKKDIALLNPKKIVELMNKHVVGQERAKKILAVAIYNHMKRVANTFYQERCPIQKSNVLLVGPTGSGKTFLIESICEELDIPLGIADATTLTETGTWGEDPENVILPLLESAGMNASMAAKGIVYIDEIDKISIGKSRGHASSGVQRSLLKIIEGKEVDVLTDGHRGGKNNSPVVKVDTKDILFIVGGAFSGIEEIIESRTGARAIGFKADHTRPDHNTEPTPEDLINYGLMPEFMGRIHNIAKLNQLTVEDLTNILTEPQNSIVDQYKNLFWHDTIVLEFEPNALEAIANHAIKQKTGARGLKTIMEKVMLETMYEAPSNDRVLIIITEEIVKAAL